ncbi:MAG: hypothetical protein HUK03_01530 [Bacteroidaceae bacterium]|nr:hypothetical protein [Bacteroidaceae bacterium]
MKKNYIAPCLLVFNVLNREEVMMVTSTLDKDDDGVLKTDTKTGSGWSGIFD